MSRTATRAGVLLAALAAAGVPGGCGGGGRDTGTTPPDRPAPRAPRGAPPLVALPPGVVAACRGMQAQVRWVVLCPSALPRATRARTPGIAPLPLGAARRGEVIDFASNAVAGPEGQVPLKLNRPVYFMHLVVGRATEGTPRGARPARLGGRSGVLATASRDGAFLPGPYFGNHVRFLWRERGTRYVATLHTFGEKPTERLLGRIVEGLRPARSLRSAPLGPATGATRIPVGPGASDVAVTPGAAWVASRGDSEALVRGALIRVDRATLRRSSVNRIGNIEPRVAAGAAGVWVATMRVASNGVSLTTTVSRLAPLSGAVMRRADLGRAEVRDVAVGDRAVWVTTSGRRRGTLWRLDPATARVTAKIALPAGAGPVVVTPGAVWVGGADRPVLARFDPRTARLTGTARVAPGGSAISGLAAAAGAVWAADSRAGTVTRVSSRTLKVAASIDVGAAPYGVTIERRGVWVAVLGDGVVRRIDPSTNRVAATIRTGGDPTAIASDGASLWVTLNSDGLVLRVPER